MFTGFFRPKLALLEGSKLLGSSMGLVPRGPGFSTGSVVPCLVSGLGFSSDLWFWGPRGPSCGLGVSKGSLVDLLCMVPRGLRVPMGSVVPFLALWLGVTLGFDNNIVIVILINLL